RGTQSRPKPDASPAQASPGSAVRADIALVRGSSFTTASGPEAPTHTASRVIWTQSAVAPSLKTADGFSPENGRWTAGTPGLGGEAGAAWTAAARSRLASSAGAGIDRMNI